MRWERRSKTDPTRIRGARALAHARSTRVYTAALLIICRRLSTSREVRSLERFSFSLYPRFSSSYRFLSFLLFPLRITSRPSLSLHFFLMPNDRSYLWGCIGIRDVYNLRIEFWVLGLFQWRSVSWIYVYRIYTASLRDSTPSNSESTNNEISKYIRRTEF